MTDTARLILAVMLGACFTCSAEPAASPTNKAVVICFNGKMDSGISCSGTLNSTGKMTSGLRGKVSEIEWRFLRRKGNADVYAFTRLFPADKAESKTEHKTVEFSGDRVTVFEDTFQVIVIQGPKAKEKAEQPGA
jgi:hypothetical protein